MTEPRYALVMLDDLAARFPLEGSVTVGRHLDNDLVVGGEDVRDFHVRIETSDRGPRVLALDGATVHLNRVPVVAFAGMKPGDELILGHHHLRLEMRGEPNAGGWKLHRVGDGQGIGIEPCLRVGRAMNCELRLAEGHISRHHAQLDCIEGTVWLEDLGSSNGTFVNGDRVVGAWRLFHGDEVAFDTFRYQLIGDAPDLTPIRPPGDAPDQLAQSAAEAAAGMQLGPNETAAVPVTEAAALTPLGGHVAGALPGGPALIGRTAPVAGRVFSLSFGRHLIGRAADAAIQLPEASVSLRHAEVDLRPDGAQLMNLISTNGTWVNGELTHTSRLTHGDIIQLGRVTLQFHDALPTTKLLRRRIWLAVAGLLAGTVFVTFLWQILR